MLQAMTKVQIIGAKALQQPTVRLLQRLGVMQIESWQDSQSAMAPGNSLGNSVIQLRERLLHLITRVEAMLSALPDNISTFSPTAYQELDEQKVEFLVQIVEEGIGKLEPQLQDLIQTRTHLEDRLSALPRYAATLRQVLPLIPADSDMEYYSMAAVLLERRYHETLQIIIDQLTEQTEGLCEVLSRPVDADTIAAVLIFPKSVSNAVGDLLGRENIAQVRLPSELEGESFEQALSTIEQRMQKIPKELDRIQANLLQLAQTWRESLQVWQTLLRENLDQIDICTHFGATDSTFIIEGWMPASRLPELEESLNAEVGDELMVVRLPLNSEEQQQAPVVLENRRLVKPFEPLVKLLSLPKYGTYDPTALMSFFLPLFFGMILGDIAYGAILFLIMLYLRRRFVNRATLRSLAEVLMIGSVWGVVFGFVYGEFLGTLGESVGIHPLWFDRGHDVESLFLMTGAIGAGHIFLGIILGIWDAIRRSSRHRFIEKTSMLVALIALFLLTAVLADYLPDSLLTPVIALLIVALVVLIYTMGRLGPLLGPLEVLGTVGNILSYLRIAAVGLASVYLAQVANELVGAVGNVFVGLIIATLLHSLNIVLGAFSPTIQSLRLHYVEFFSKFYEGGGRPFQPFQRSIPRHR